jgi:hypothetical protein
MIMGIYIFVLLENERVAIILTYVFLVHYTDTVHIIICCKEDEIYLGVQLNFSNEFFMINGWAH